MHRVHGQHRINSTFQEVPASYRPSHLLHPGAVCLSAGRLDQPVGTAIHQVPAKKPKGTPLDWALQNSTPASYVLKDTLGVERQPCPDGSVRLPVCPVGVAAMARRLRYQSSNINNFFGCESAIGDKATDGIARCQSPEPKIRCARRGTLDKPLLVETSRNELCVRYQYTQVAEIPRNLVIVSTRRYMSRGATMKVDDLLARVAESFYRKPCKRRPQRTLCR